MHKLENAIFICFAFFLINTMFLDINFLIANIIMSIVCFLVIYNAYDQHNPLFTLNNLFVSFFFGLGVLARYIFLAYDFGDAMHFASYPLPNSPEYQMYTAFCIFIAIVFFILGKNLYKIDSFKKNNINTALYKKEHFLKILRILQFFGIFILGFIFLYKVNNLRYAVDGTFGVYDNIINTLFILIKYIACISFIVFLLVKDKISLFFAVASYVPEIIFSIIMAWKGPILIIIISLFIALALVKKRKNKVETKKILLVLLVFFLVYPFISMYRVNLQLGTTYYDYSLSSFVEYNTENNIFTYISNRFSYYDEIYYVINCSDEKKEAFLNNAGLIHERFFNGIIPRIIYEDKKVVNIGVDITHYLMEKPLWFYNNITISYIGDAWISYGLVGVGLINLLVGYFIAAIENKKDINIFYASKYLLICGQLLSFIEGDIAGKMIIFILIFLSTIIVDSCFSIFGYKIGDRNVKIKTC